MGSLGEYFTLGIQRWDMMVLENSCASSGCHAPFTLLCYHPWGFPVVRHLRAFLVKTAQSLLFRTLLSYNTKYLRTIIAINPQSNKLPHDSSESSRTITLTIQGCFAR